MKLYSILSEASYEKDRWYRFEANKIYNKIMPILKKQFKFRLKHHDIINTESGVSWNVNNVDKKYNVRIFLWINKKEPTGRGYFSISNPKEPQILLFPWDHKKNKLTDIKQTFIHEFIHYLDWLRSKGYSPKGGTAKHGMEHPSYFNHPWEFNAYFQDGADAMERWIKENKLYVRRVWKSYDAFMKLITQENGELYFFNTKFIKNLDDKFKKKFQQRLYQFWVAMKEKYGEK